MSSNKDNIWLRERKDLLFKNVVRDFLQARAAFLSFGEGEDKREISYHAIEELVGSEGRKGILWNLKDACHAIFRKSAPYNHPDEFMFDWIVGAIFHEAMKLKENLYLVQRYRPAFQAAGEAEATTAYRHKCERLFSMTMEEILASRGRISCMLSAATEHLKSIVREGRENPLLIRFLIEREEARRDAGMPAGIEREILLDAFPDGLERAYCIAGESYLENNWYPEARIAFERAIEVLPDCAEARNGLRLLDRLLKTEALLLERQYVRECERRGIPLHSPRA